MRRTPLFIGAFILIGVAAIDLAAFASAGKELYLLAAVVELTAALILICIALSIRPL